MGGLKSEGDDTAQDGAVPSPENFDNPARGISSHFYINSSAAFSKPSLLRGDAGGGWNDGQVSVFISLGSKHTQPLTSASKLKLTLF